MKKGSWSYPSVNVYPSNATNQTLYWYSSNPNIASVNSNSGYIYANEVGTARIYATATDGSGCSDYITVTVTNTVSVSSVTLNRSTASLEVGSSITLGATVCPENATNRSVNWSSSNSSVASVSGGVVCAHAQGSATITATAADGSGNCDCCTVTVTGNVLVTSVAVIPSNKTLSVGGSCYLSASVLPSNASNQTVTWSSSNSAVATVNTSGLVYAHSAGSAIIYATAQDGSGCVGCCQVTVASVAVSSITVSPKHCTLSIDETKTLYTSICPSNASNKSIVWTSSNTSVATVGTYTGIVTAISDGEVTITARSVSGNKTDTCTVVVDSRERVQVKKDSHSFYVEFEDGKIWKNIGLDLSKREENYNALYPPNFWYENYEDLIEEEQRYFDNVYIEDVEIGEPIVEETYSVKQIAFLYLLDPLGIEYYMRNHACHDKDIMSGEFLTYKDEVYEAIFGTSERSTGRFYFRIVDGVAQYGRYAGYDRMDVYSNAEVLFGSHTIFNWSDFWQSIGTAIFENIPIISHIILGVEMYQALFFSGSIVSAMSGIASEYLDDYAEETSNTVLTKMLGWPNTVFSCFTAISEALIGAFELDNLNDMTIYSKIQEQDYRTEFDNYGSKLSIQEIIEKCSANN